MYTVFMAGNCFCQWPNWELPKFASVTHFMRHHLLRILFFFREILDQLPQKTFCSQLRLTLHWQSSATQKNDQVTGFILVVAIVRNQVDGQAVRVMAHAL